MSTSPVFLSRYYPTFAIVITNSLNSTYVSSDNLSLDFHFSLNLHPKTYCNLQFYNTYMPMNPSHTKNSNKFNPTKKFTTSPKQSILILQLIKLCMMHYSSQLKN